MSEELKFDSEKHIYTIGDKRLPSVTEIVGNVCGSPTYANEWHLQRGTRIHRCIALYLCERLDESSVDPRIWGRVDQAKKAIRELKIHPSLIEYPMYHKVLGFAGTPDLLTDKSILVDWKSAKMRETEIQAGGYIALLENNGYSVKKCYEIVLEDDRYIVSEYKPARSKGLFLSALTIFQWRRKNG